MHVEASIRKPCYGKEIADAAAVLFADNIHYKFKSIAKLRKPGFRAPNIPAKNRI